ncbi:hypothetical protein [Pseudoxanthomonas sp. OG2]|uniref:hypothetical protein n=1 Tax=Pseudoxanthomonas sp. OG2 TaxID=2587011 RepID=UPI001622759F|nr:hypothetical protein [Pseudoxanthomonas sp. OG2]MBB3277409.1 hypothetical protein [Pseudoxanthomonas sp. OG2]
MGFAKHDFVALRLRFLKQDDFEQIDHLVAAVGSYVSRAKAELADKHASLAADAELDQSLQGFEEMLIDDEVGFYEELKPLASELSIVALYKRIEILTKRAVTTAHPSINPAQLFKFNQLKAALLATGLDLQTVSNYVAADETRALNNCVKHSGKVSEELAAYPGWTLGEPLGDLERAYVRLAPLCLDYINDLIEKLIEQRLNSSV